MDCEKAKQELDKKATENNNNFEEKQEKELVTLIANIIVEKVLKQDGQERNTILKV
ncbi:hypothetical protein [Longitalea luteola]|uniref:hypothetical protein n=1 Tax=Longitalea luteola TaxID=2812563 RepID=UPI001A97C43D|nr:hypothetical protein [Longitalea luteola]